MKPAVRSMLEAVPRAVDRRAFFKTLGLGAAGAMALTGDAAATAAADFVQAGVKRTSEPSALKITDMRVATVVKPGPSPCPIIRIDTKTIRAAGRSTQGVRLLHLEEEDKVAAAVVIPPEEAKSEPENGTLLQ